MKSLLMMVSLFVILGFVAAVVWSQESPVVPYNDMAARSEVQSPATEYFYTHEPTPSTNVTTWQGYMQGAYTEQDYGSYMGGSVYGATDRYGQPSPGGSVKACQAGGSGGIDIYAYGMGSC